MNSTLRKDAETIIRAAIAAVRPDAAVTRALSGLTFPGRVLLVSAGKAGWQMASAAIRCLNVPADGGIVLTKYGHVAGRLHGLTCFEAGHPVPDANSFRGTQAVLDLTADLGPEDTVLFLLSGGGSALFEKPLIDPEELRSITEQLLACGADIVEMNTIRKRLSAVKGGRFARWCAPARVEAVILSDIVGDPLDMIASGPAAADPSTCGQAMAIVEKYRLRLSAPALDCLRRETPKTAGNVHTQVIGSVRELCRAAKASCEALGYRPQILTDRLGGEAREAGIALARALKALPPGSGRTALIAGGETVVRLTGSGLAWGDGIRSWPWPRRRSCGVCGMPPSSARALTEPTGPRMRRAVMWTAAPLTRCWKRASTWQTLCRTMTPITRWRRQAALSRPALRAPT